MPRTIVVFHAHPDDESLLTAGTMARSAAEGHRVVLVLATDGGLGRGDTSPVESARLGALRLDEARASAAVLGVARFAYLGYADSGADPEGRIATTDRETFALAPVAEVAGRLAGILAEERADLLLCDDRNGGYGHPDHVRAHRVAMRAAALAGTPRVLQATAPRELLRLPCALASLAVGRPSSGSGSVSGARPHRVYSHRAEITHRISVRRQIAAKRASLRAHASQTARRGGTDRMLAAFLLIPRPVFDVVFGREWFVQAGQGLDRQDIVGEPPRPDGSVAPSRIRR